MSWRTSGRAGRGVQALSRTASEPLRLHVVSTVSNFGAEMMWTQGLGLLPRVCTQGSGSQPLCQDHRSRPITLARRHHSV